MCHKHTLPLLLLFTLVTALLMAGCSPSSESITAGTGRTMTIQAVSGTVEVRTSGAETFTTVQTGQTIAAGDTLQTDPDGEVVLRLDDGTVIVIGADSFLDVATLEGTTETPVSRFFLNVGEVFSIRGEELPEGAAYQVETPAGIAAIRGSSMGVSYDDMSGTGTISCFEGLCAATIDGEEREIPGGQFVGTQIGGFIGDVQPLTPRQVQRWHEVITTAEEAGEAGVLDSTCDCEGLALVCSDGTRIEGYPGCIEEVSCECVGPDLMCSDGSQTPGHPGCTIPNAELEDCACDGPNMVCADGTVFPVDPFCVSDTPCHCEGPDLLCDDGTLYEDEPFCIDPGALVSPGCTCNGPDLRCEDGLVFPDDPLCTGEFPNCVCEGPDLVCTDGAIYPDDEKCQPDFSQPGCVCFDGYSRCEDGLILVNDPACPVPPFPPGCACEGPNLVCDGGKVSELDPFCAGEGVDCQCDGPDMTCSNGFTEQDATPCTGAPMIPPDADCDCQGPDLVCSDGYVEAGSPACEDVGSGTCGDAICDAFETEYPSECPEDCSDVPGTTCSCEDSTLVCTDGAEFPDATRCIPGKGDLCGDGVCDAFETANPGECPEDCP